MQSFQHGELRSRLKANGLTDTDLTWLDSIGWSDAAVPALHTPSEVNDYARRERVLHAAVADQLLGERAHSVEGKLAAAIGAELANWRDRAADSDDE